MNLMKFLNTPAQNNNYINFLKCSEIYHKIWFHYLTVTYTSSPFTFVSLFLLLGLYILSVL